MVRFPHIGLTLVVLKENLGLIPGFEQDPVGPGWMPQLFRGIPPIRLQIVLVRWRKLDQTLLKV